MSKVLHLTLKKRWFDMIASGEKKEEYREIKPYWIRRLDSLGGSFDIDYKQTVIKEPTFIKFDRIIFRNGYAKNAPKIELECLGIDIGPAKPEWSDNWQGKVFIIKLGNIIS